MFDVSSEICPLKKVLVHRPGNELLNLNHDLLKEMLYEDIPYLKVSRLEHDEMVSQLRKYGIDVLYIEDLMTDVLNMYPEIKEKFVRQYVYEAGIVTPKYKTAIINFLMSFNDNRDLVLKTIEGINLSDLCAMEMDFEHSLVDLVAEEVKLLVLPMPNLLFLRDNLFTVGNGIGLTNMMDNNRKRECIYMEYILQYHPEYKNSVKYYDKYFSYNIEGGDIINLSEKVLGIGVSERTSAEAIEELATNIFNDDSCRVETILAFNIPKERFCMHLDTVISQVDYDKFLYYPGIIDKLKIFEIRKDVIDGIKVKEIVDKLENVLEKYLKREVVLIPCGGGDQVIANREQWNDAVNVLCIKPGVVISYDRNNITNAILRRYGVKVIEISSSELSRGRGGPRCMCLPIIRDKE